MLMGVEGGGGLGVCYALLWRLNSEAASLQPTNTINFFRMLFHVKFCFQICLFETFNPELLQVMKIE